MYYTSFEERKRQNYQEKIKIVPDFMKIYFKKEGGDADGKKKKARKLHCYEKKKIHAKGDKQFIGKYSGGPLIMDSE